MKKHKKISIIAVSYIVFILCMAIFLFVMYDKSIQNVKEGDLSAIHISGTYQEDSGEWVPFEKVNDINPTGKKLLLKGHVSKNIPVGDNIMMYLYRLDVEVTLNGELLYSTGDSNLTRWESFKSLGITTEDEIVITMSKLTDRAYKGSYKIFSNHLYSGTEINLLHKQVRSKSIKIIFCIATFLMGIATVLVSVSLCFFQIPETKGYISCGLLLMVGSICSFIDYEYITLIFSNVLMINIIDFLSQVLIVVLTLVYLKNYITTRKYIYITDGMITILLGSLVYYFVIRIKGYVNETKGIVYFVFEAIIMLLIITYFLRKEFKVNPELRTKRVLLSGLFMATCAFVEIVHFYITNIFWIFVFQIGLTIFTIIQYAVMISYTRDIINDAKKKKEMEMEVIKSQIAVMMSQIQPHFLYNTISGIQVLCTHEPNKAAEALNKFGRFLRSNMDSLSTSDRIPFSQEIEHVKNFMYLQQMRLEERLKVIYDIQVDDFTIPALTMQPLVENAVHHGIVEKEVGGTVIIRTRRQDNQIKIDIIDDGVGFDVTAYEAEIAKQNMEILPTSHVGIENIRKRIGTQCQGTVTIHSELGRGTTVTITVPE